MTKDIKELLEMSYKGHEVIEYIEKLEKAYDKVCNELFEQMCTIELDSTCALMKTVDDWKDWGFRNE